MRNYRASPTFAASYIQVRARAVVWECGEGQTDRQTDTDSRGQYTFRLGYASYAKCNNSIVFGSSLCINYVSIYPHSATFDDLS